ncbi:hypothetical protein ACQP04_02600 [Pseudonocardia halophobica]|uniref:hypothetical protein n=1 Tax=Pseudonocardia halophobica TaxID=29401 RepID=UPI003D8CDCAB
MARDEQFLIDQEVRRSERQLAHLTARKSTRAISRINRQSGQTAHAGEADFAVDASSTEPAPGRSISRVRRRPVG